MHCERNRTAPPSGRELEDVGRSSVLVRARSQAGFSLTESLAAILLVTLVIMGIAAGILTSVRATRTVSETQKAEAALSDATETIKAKPFVPCAVSTSYGALAGVTVSTVVYLQPGTSGKTFGPACPTGQDAAQQITVVVNGRKADIVKRDPAASP